MTRDYAAGRDAAHSQAASGTTIVLVTHDIDEAIRLGSRIVILEAGRIVQSGTPREILTQPANDFVADFVGREDIGIKLLSIETVGRAHARRRDGRRRADRSHGEPAPCAVA